jgi:metalloprotease
MKRYILAILSLMFLVSCEDTNVLMMTDAASDAVTAITLTDENVRNLAQQAAHAIDNKYRVALADNPYDARLRRILADFSEKEKSTFNFKVYLTKEINAFAMADGSIRVYSGLMDLMNDEELIFIIGHEMGHVVKKHSRKKVALAYASSALKKGLASQDNEVGQIARSMVGVFAEHLTNAQFSQHEERQADQYGAAFLQGKGHETSAAVSALKKLAALAKQHTFLSSHPHPEARAKRLLRGETSESADQVSLLERLTEYGKMIVAGLFSLVLSLLNWLFSLFK